MMKPYTILDLCGGAGGSAKGYHDAGFKVIGVDLHPQPRYPYEFIQHDALELLSDIADYGVEFVLADAYGPIDAIHISPPCQRWSVMSKCRPGLADKYPDLITPARALLRQTGLPFIIENVPGAPLREPLTLCGTQFGLVAEWPGRGRYGLRRHREFETWPFKVPAHPYRCDHLLPSLPVYGHGAAGNRPELRGQGFAELAREGMQIDWMTRSELAEAVPPAYTEYIGEYLWTHLRWSH
jgi:DNA (cytosine-5)-methyltransferase 1